MIQDPDRSPGATACDDCLAVLDHLSSKDRAVLYLCGGTSNLRPLAGWLAASDAIGKIALLVEDEAAARTAWSMLNVLPSVKRPLILFGDLNAVSKRLPFGFDAILVADPAAEARLAEASLSDLLVGWRAIIKAKADGGDDANASWLASELPTDLSDRVHVTEVAAPRMGAPAERFDDSSWEKSKVVFEAFYGRTSEERRGVLEADLLRLWVERARTTLSGHWPQLSDGGLTRPNPGSTGQQWPKISVVIPTFNQGDYIEETLLSLVHQNYPSLEIIVMDGGSSDETPKILERYRRHLAHVTSEPDKGQSNAINKGMAVATGDILTWLNSDDMLAEGALFAIATGFITSGADLVAGICRIHVDHVYEAEHLTSCEPGILPLDQILDLDGGWNGGQFFYQPEVFFSRSIWERGGARVREDLYYSMDYELWMRFAALRARIHVIGSPVALFRRHENQKTHAVEKFKEELKVLRDAYVAQTGARVNQNVHGESQRRLSFCFLNDIGYVNGAGIAHRRLADAIVAAGHRVDALQFVQLPGGPEHAERSPAELEAAIAATDCDIVIIGNIHYARVDPSVIERIANQWPTLIIAHDFWWVTGRCAYTHGCEKLLEGCDASCPTPNEYPALEPERIAGAWLQKRTLLAQHPNIVLVANSKWCHDFLASSGAVKPERIDQIKLGLDADYFDRRDKATARIALGLPPNSFLLMMSTTALRDPRKGVAPLLDKFEAIGLTDVKVVVLGHAAAAERENLPDFCILPGYVENRDELFLYYAAADVVVGCSKEETFGQVFAEAGALGTPVIAYGSTGVSEAVRDGWSGWLTETDNLDELIRLVLMMKLQPWRIRSLQALGPLYLRNEHSLEACYQSFFAMLHRQGLLERFGVRRNITFFTDRKPAPEGTVIGEQGAVEPVACSGVGGMETDSRISGPDATFRWMHAPEAEFQIPGPQKGPRYLYVVYRNPIFDTQEVECHVNGVACHLEIVPRREQEAGVFTFACELPERRNSVRLKFGKHHVPEGDGRPLALMLIGIGLV